VLQSGWEHEAGWQAMLETLERFAIPHSFHRVVPFVGELEPPPEPHSPEVICFGSYSMRHYATKMGWNPGVFDLASSDFVVQRQHWGDAMLNADSEVVAFKDVAFTGERFIRPIEDTKAFTGAIFDSHKFADWQRRVIDLGEDIGSSLTGATLVQVSTPKSIHAEIRCWMIEGRAVTASAYKQGDRVFYSDVVDRRFTDYAEGLAAAWSPEKAFCLDVCDTDDGMRIVEINTINSAGFYAADMQKLVMALDDLRR